MSDDQNNEEISMEEFLEQEEDRRFMRQEKVKKLLEDMGLDGSFEITPLNKVNINSHTKTVNNYEKDKVFNWENDTEMNPDFELWELELLQGE